jgi:hypothetical protein
MAIPLDRLLYHAQIVQSSENHYWLGQKNQQTFFPLPQPEQMGNHELKITFKGVNFKLPLTRLKKCG